MLSNHKWLIFGYLFIGLAHVIAAMFDGYYDTTLLKEPTKQSVVQIATFNYPFITGDLWIVAWVLNGITAVLVAVLFYEGICLLRGVRP